MSEKKRAKRDLEHLTEAEEPLPIRERIRNQWDVLDFERRMLDGMDQSVRYGMVIFTTASTFAAILLTRADVLLSLSPSALLATRLLAALYAVLAITILMGAARVLRPGYSPKDLAKFSATPSGPQAARPLRVLQTLMPTSVDHASLATLHDSWSTVSGEQLSSELTQACVFLRSLIETKYHALRRLYTNLGLMLLLAVSIGIVVVIMSALK